MTSVLHHPLIYQYDGRVDIMYAVGRDVRGRRRRDRNEDNQHCQEGHHMDSLTLSLYSGTYCILLYTSHGSKMISISTHTQLYYMYKKAGSAVS